MEYLSIETSRPTGEREDFSLRKLAEAIDLPASNLSYIENGVNFPTAEIYSKIINVLRKIFANNELKKPNTYANTQGIPQYRYQDIIKYNLAPLGIIIKRG